LLISAFSLIESEATTGRNSTFFQSLAFDKELGATRGIDAALHANRLDALVLPAAGLTTVPAGMVVMFLLKNDLNL
jgi:amidase